MGQTNSSTLTNNVNDESKVTSSSDHSNTVSASILLYNHKLRKRCEHVCFDLEAWYSILQSQTFDTEFIPISPAVARAFVNYYQTRYNSKLLLNSNDIDLIQSIQEQIKEQIFSPEIDKFSLNGAFVRLSVRSPKDGTPLDPQKLLQYYRKNLEELQEKYPDEYQTIDGQANMQLVAFSRAQFDALKVINETEAMNLILSSERVFIDLLDVLCCQEVQENQALNTDQIELFPWNNHIIFRQWNSALDPSMEFRCFVYQSNLTAISQYNHYCKFYQLQNEFAVQEVKMAIIDYWQKNIKPLLDGHPTKYSNYVVDIGLMKDESTNEFQCLVIELNPFATSTGASLFSWKSDVEQLTGEKDQIEIRIRSDYFPNINDYVDYVLTENKLTADNNISSSDNDHEPYFVFLNRMREQFSS